VGRFERAGLFQWVYWGGLRQSSCGRFDVFDTMYADDGGAEQTFRTAMFVAISEEGYGLTCISTAAVSTTVRVEQWVHVPQSRVSREASRCDGRLYETRHSDILYLQRHHNALHLHSPQATSFSPTKQPAPNAGPSHVCIARMYNKTFAVPNPSVIHSAPVAPSRRRRRVPDFWSFET